MTSVGPEAPPAETKRALRAELLARRARLTSAERAESSRLVVERLEALDELRNARTLALYAPLGAEVDALAAAHGALARGARVVFPRAVPGERRLVFASCPPEELVRGPLGALEPPAGAPAVEPGALDCVVMPGVAFSEDGLRLGRGGGYYDATLARVLRAVRVGVAFDVQLVPALPHEPHDAPMDAVVTELRTLRFARESR